MEAEALWARGDTAHFYTKWRLKPPEQERIQNKFTYNMEKLNPSGQEGIRHTFTYKMEAEPRRTRGDTTQIYKQNGGGSLQG